MFLKHTPQIAAGCSCFAKLGNSVEEVFATPKKETPAASTEEDAQQADGPADCLESC